MASRIFQNSQKVKNYDAYPFTLLVSVLNLIKPQTDALRTIYPLNNSGALSSERNGAIQTDCGS
jgi:hypothetical protein